MPQNDSPWLRYFSYMCSSSSVRKGAAIRMTFNGWPWSSNKFLKGEDTIGTTDWFCSAPTPQRVCTTAAMSINANSAPAILKGIVIGMFII